MNRREFLILSSGAVLGHEPVLPARPRTESKAKSFADALRSAPPRVVTTVGSSAGADAVKLLREWNGELCRSRLVNTGSQSVRIREVVLFSFKHDLARETTLYGESFQMLSQTAGTISKPVDLGYSERHHYRIPQPEDATALSGLLMLSTAPDDHLLLAFTSCRRFIGRFYLRGNSIEIALHTEGLELRAGETWELEEFTFAEGADRSQLLTGLAARINANHPHQPFRPIPTGWCSWYCFGPRVTAANVTENLGAIAKQIPGLRYIQIDDGYQAAMGDWLETGAAFGGDVVSVLKQIRQRGLEPAIWVAPFIAEAKSHVFQGHPEWFIQSAEGNPLAADRVTFGGWRHGPWYALDGTHPEVQRYFERLFRTMRQDWGCTYFKLDANFWGAMHGGRFYDPKASRIEAYRRGMQAIRDGAGDSFLLGCNHPIWPSFGLIDGSRSSGDIKRSWERFAREARQTLMRNWQDGRLWWNDPDAVVLTGALTDNEFQFHAAATYASGGVVLSGDDLTTMPANRLAMLRKLLPPTGVPATFTDESLQVGHVELQNTRVVCLFNWGEQTKTMQFHLAEESQVTDYWSGETLGRRQGKVTIRDIPPHSARLLACKRK